MKKFILSLIFGIGILFSMSSCVSSAYAQDVVISSDSDGDVDISIVLRCGTPYYFEGNVLYYLYDGWYYYPYLIDNHYYYYRYSRPLPPPRHGYRFTPRHYDRPYVHHRHHRDYNPMRSSTYGHRPHNNHHNGGIHNNGIHHRGGGNGMMHKPRMNHATPRGNGHFGGRR